MKFRMLRLGVRYGANLVAMVARQRGYMAATAVGSQFVIAEVAKLPRFARLVLSGRTRPARNGNEAPVDWDEIRASLSELGVDMQSYYIDVAAFHAHVEACGYPHNYAAGSADTGGGREEKLLEYFVSLDLLAVLPTDVVVDVASEWSIFPEVLRSLSGATVYRQDLIYPPGIDGDRIGGSAAQLPVPHGFADKLVLHNSFEHFEGTADTDFILEAWRVLKPGGALCILPLFVSDHYKILSDPLVARTGISWDEGAHVVELPWFRHRFGRFYDATQLQRRVLAPAHEVGLIPTIYSVVNTHEVHRRAHLRFALLMRKPLEHEQDRVEGGDNQLEVLV